MKNKEQLKQEYINKETIGWDEETLNRYLPEVEVYFEEWYKGFSANKIQTEKLLKDLRNKYNSNLSELLTPKLSKTANYEREVSYRAYIEVIDEMLKKLNPQE